MPGVDLDESRGLAVWDLDGVAAAEERQQRGDGDGEDPLRRVGDDVDIHGRLVEPGGGAGRELHDQLDRGARRLPGLVGGRLGDGADRGDRRGHLGLVRQLDRDLVSLGDQRPVGHVQLHGDDLRRRGDLHDLDARLCGLPDGGDVRTDAHRPGGEDDLAGLDRAGLLEAEVGLPLLDGLLCVVVELTVDRAGVVAERLQVLLELEHVAALDSVLEAPPGGKVADEEHDRALVDAVEDAAAAARGALGREGGDRAARPGGEALCAGEAERAAERLGLDEVAHGGLRRARRHGSFALGLVAADVREEPGGDPDARDDREGHETPEEPAARSPRGRGRAVAVGSGVGAPRPKLHRPAHDSPS